MQNKRCNVWYIRISAIVVQFCTCFAWHLGDANWWKQLIIAWFQTHQPVSTEDFSYCYRRSYRRINGLVFSINGFTKWDIRFWSYEKLFKWKIDFERKTNSKNWSKQRITKLNFSKVKMDIEIDGKINQIWLNKKPNFYFRYCNWAKTC